MTDDLEKKLPAPPWMKLAGEAYEQVEPLDEEMRKRVPTFDHGSPTGRILAIHYPDLERLRSRPFRGSILPDEVDRVERFETPEGHLGFRIGGRVVDLDYGKLEERVLAMHPALGEPYRGERIPFMPPGADIYKTFADEFLGKIAKALGLTYEMLAGDYDATVRSAVLACYIASPKISKRRKRRLRGRVKALKRRMAHVPAYDYSR